MSANRPTKITNKYCDTCGQKNYRPHRSLRELFAEFVEDWLGYDSKLFQTLKALFIPARLSKDYFANSNHKNHYITPIRLYLLLSVIFFILTNFAGFSLTEIKLDEITVTEAQTTSSEPTKKPTEEEGNSISFSSDETQFNSKKGCIKDPAEMINLWPDFLDQAIDSQVEDLCQKYKGILYLPEEERRETKAQFGLRLAQQAIESIPQTFFLSLPLLAFLLGLFYISRKKKHIYVEHLVVLMHSHSFIFAACLLYLGWYRLESYFPWLDNLQMDFIFLGALLLYVFLTQKWFYQRGWWSTFWRFFLFGVLYLFIVSFVLSLAALIGLLSS